MFPTVANRPRISNSVANMRPSGIRRFFDIAATMEDVITLAIGEPSYVTPPHILQAGVASLQAGQTSYTSNSGMLELRQAVSDYIHRLYNIRYQPDNQVLITVGVSEGLYLAMKAILNPGDEVLVVEPCFVAYAAAVELAGGVAVSIPTSPENNFQVTGADLEPFITERTRVILIGYPNNPTGAVLPYANMLEIAHLAELYDLLVVSDEIYERLIYGWEHVCFATLPNMMERTILMSGMSKSFAMTGWRIGYITAPQDIMSAMRKIHQYLIMSAPTMGQVAAVQALNHGDADVEHMRQGYDRRRRLIVEGFNRLGLTCFEPRGAFYAFPNISASGLDEHEFCERLLTQERVAMIPGSAFGSCGTGFVRASYTNTEENIAEALVRIERFLNSLS